MEGGWMDQPGPAGGGTGMSSRQLHRGAGGGCCRRGDGRVVPGHAGACQGMQGRAGAFRGVQEWACVKTSCMSSPGIIEMPCSNEGLQGHKHNAGTGTGTGTCVPGPEYTCGEASLQGYRDMRDQRSFLQASRSCSVGISFSHFLDLGIAISLEAPPLAPRPWHPSLGMVHLASGADLSGWCQTP